MRAFCVCFNSDFVKECIFINSYKFFDCALLRGGLGVEGIFTVQRALGGKDAYLIDRDGVCN